MKYSRKTSKSARLVLCCAAICAFVFSPILSIAAHAATADKVSVRLAWFANGEEAYWAYGVKAGIFKAEGIDLEINEGSGSAATLRAVGSEIDRFGAVSAYALAGFINKGLPVKMISNQVPAVPSAILFFDDKHIEKPKDLEGKKIAFTAGDINHTLFKIFVQKNGIDMSKVRDVYFDPRGKVAAMIGGQVDALAGFYTFSVPTIEKTAKKQVKFLRYVDFGVRMLGEGIVINTKFLGDRDLNCRFVRAAAHARAEAAKHPDDAVTALLEMFPKAGEPDVAKKIWMAIAAMERSKHATGKPLGYMADEDWDVVLDVLKNSGGDAVMSDRSAYYTNEFVDCS